MKGNAHVSCIKYRNLNNLSHYHSDHELICVHKGNAAVTVNDKVFDLTGGGCVFIHSNDIHYVHSNENTEITVLKARSKHFESIFSAKKLVSPLLKTDINAEETLNEIRAELACGHENFDIMADSMASRLFILMLRSEQTAAREEKDTEALNTNALYTEICEMITEDFRTVTFKEAAERMHFSEPYFSKVFHSIFGMTFTKYVNTVKTAAAIEMLKEGSKSITHLSASCGFNTIRNFNRVFKGFTGYAPNALPADYVFLYSLKEGLGLDPTLNCTEILEQL